MRDFENECGGSGCSLFSGTAKYTKEIRQKTFNEAKAMASRHVPLAGGEMWGGVDENMTRYD